MKNKIIIYMVAILMIVLTIKSAVAITEWVQYTPSPTTSGFQQVIAIGSRAFAITGNAGNCYLYNGTWQEVLCPNDALNLSNPNIIGSIGNYQQMFKMGNGKIVFVFGGSEGATRNISVILYDITNNTYSSYRNTTDSAYTPSWVAGSDEANSKVYVWTEPSGDHKVMEVYPNLNNITDGVTDAQPIISDDGLYGTTGSNFYYWNGLSWILKGTQDHAVKHIKKSTNEQALITYGDGYLYFFNSTSSTFNYGILLSGGVNSEGRGGFYLGDYIQYNWGYSGSHNITKFPFNTQSYSSGTTTLITPSKDIASIDIDRTTGNAWAVGESGYMYYYNGSSGGSATYSVDLRIDPNPVIEGTSTIFHITPTSSYGYTSSIDLDIYDMSDNWLYQASAVGIASGSTTQLYLQGTYWSDFYAGQNYKVVATATSSVMEVATHTDYMNVTSTIRTNVTTYKASSFTITIPHNMYGLAHYDEKNTYTAFSNSSGLYLARFESTNPANISMSIRNTKISDETSADQVNDLDMLQGNDKLFIGSDNDLLVYDNISQKRVDLITYRSATGLDGSDEVFDVKAYDHELVAVCQNDFDNILYNDDFYWFNSSNTTFYWNRGIDPCKSIELYGQTAFVHRGGTLDIISFDSPTGVLFSSIDVGSTSTYSTHDLLSLSGNNLYAITNLYYAQRFDIRNTSNVLVKENCFVVGYDHEITSIEAIYNDTLILGTKYTSGLGGIQYYACDYSNNETYKVNYYGYTGYEAQPITTGVGLTSYECKKMNSLGKFGCVEGDTLNIIYYGKTIENITLNQAPVIDQINVSDDTPCLNQYINPKIVAYDTEGDELTYDCSCEGTYLTMRNEYRTPYCPPCVYTSTGTKKITAFVDDNIEGSGRPVKKERIINVEDCVANNTIQILLYECDSTGTRIDTTKPINSASITFNLTGEVQYTDNDGLVYFNNIPEDKAYSFVFNKSGYYSEVKSISPPSAQTCLKLMGTAGSTGLTIFTQNSSGNRVGGSLVSMTNTIEGTNAFGFTNADGFVVLTGVYGSKILVTATNKEMGYPDTYNYYVDLSYGESKTITITFGVNVLPEGQFSVTDRGCKDMITGILLCGNLSIYNNGSSCHLDSDCLSDSCIRKKINATAYESDGECSGFNWSVCDRDGLGRGQGCFMIKTTYGGISSFVDGVIIKYMFLTLAVVFILFFIVIARRKK